MTTEEFKVTGEQLVSTIKKLVRAGNIRRISIRKENGDMLLEVPLTVGAIGALLLPTLAAIGAVAALVTKCSIVVERVDK
jgi:hypothetical protein